MRLDKFLTSCYLGTRKEVKQILKQKRIKVNDIIVTSEDANIVTKKDVIKLDDKILNYRENYYFLLNKPQGYVTSTVDEASPSVMQLFNDLNPLLKKDLFPVGRLDKDTEGMLIITTDGNLAHQLTSPKKHVKKVYYVEYEGNLSPSKLAKLKTGLVDEKGEPFLPASLKQIDSNSCYLTISEGKYHQVKRMIHLLGGCLTYLKRVQIGSLMLPTSLEKGKYIVLTNKDINKILDNEDLYL